MIYLLGKTVANVFETFHTSKKGLSEKQASIARERYGDNKISYGKKTPFILEVLKAYITPFTLVLIGLGLTSITTDVLMAAPADRDYFGSAIIFTMVIISGTMTLIQSVRSNHAAEKLKSLVKSQRLFVGKINSLSFPSRKLSVEMSLNYLPVI